MKPLSLSVVGHTNTGKTSLLRTLLRDEGFGEVKNEAATTRHVEEATIHDQDKPLVRLYDTPGLEDAAAVLDWLEANTSVRKDGVERLEVFLKSEPAASALSQEAKVLHQLLQSDVALYVVDAREPVLDKYRDELTILSWAAKPVMPVFNFTQGQDSKPWRDMLARRGLHVQSNFDTVAFDFESEIKLWQNLATMLAGEAELAAILHKLIDTRKKDWQRLNADSRCEIAHFLLEVCAYKKTMDESEDAAPVLVAMQQAVRQSEYQLQQKLLHYYRFYHDAAFDNDSTLHAFQKDPFDSELWKEYGIRAGKGATAGALFGLAVDAIALGTTFGAGTAIGGMVGGVLPNIDTIGDKIAGRKTLYIDTASIIRLAVQATGLLYALQQRGHATQTPIAIAAAQPAWQAKGFTKELEQARYQAKFSTLNHYSGHSSRAARESAAQRLAALLPEM